VAIAGRAVAVRWHKGLRNIIHGTTKNFFAADNFNPGQVLMRVAGMISLSLFPFVSLFLTSGLDWLLGLSSVLIAAGVQGRSAHESDISMCYGLSHPLGTVIFSYILARSMVVTLWRGGVLWRGTFYPLNQLRRGRV
jgi:cytochrome b subunit of formate dehydrogenase